MTLRADAVGLVAVSLVNFAFEGVRVLRPLPIAGSNPHERRTPIALAQLLLDGASEGSSDGNSLGHAESADDESAAGRDQSRESTARASG